MSDQTEHKIKELEQRMQSAGFWDDKEKAQEVIAEYNRLKSGVDGESAFDRGDAIVTILAGAGGTDSEDFARILAEMYWKFAEHKGWPHILIHQNENPHGGFRNISFEVNGKNAYGILKNESGVHRLVRISPFNAKQQRHTSFAMVEVLPKRVDVKAVELNPDEVEVSFARSSGPGGQNVNKRETAVRAVHTPTNISVLVDSERSQAQNKEKAFELLRSKLYKKREEDRKKEEAGMSVSATTSIEWGNQIRSYVLHPYKMVKDHRTGVETQKVEEVLDGELDEFIEGEREL